MNGVTKPTHEVHVLRTKRSPAKGGEILFKLSDIPRSRQADVDVRV